MSFDLKSTDPVYTWKLGSDEMKMCGLQKYNDELFSVISTELVIMEWREGTKRMSRKMAFGALCPPVRNDEFYYIAGADERIHVLRASNLVEFFNASANDGFHISAVNADNQSVIFATDGGTVISMQPDRRIQNWKFNAEGAVNSSVIRDNGQVIFSSKDAYIYALSESKGKLLWKYLTPALLKEPPVATDKFIYQAVDGQGLIAIDRNGGELAFQVPNGDALLSEYNGKAYIMTRRRNLIVMDTAKKKEVSRIELPMISRWTSNVESREICLADDYGRIVCVKPIDF
jgi:outer membrane protein assembly factor BamB